MSTSKLSNFIADECRLSEIGEIGKLLSDSSTKGLRDLLFKKVKEPESMKISSSAGKMKKASVGSISLAAVSSSAKTGKGKGSSQSKGYSSQAIGKMDLNLPNFVSPSPGTTKPNKGNKNPVYLGIGKKTPPSTPFIPPSTPRIPGYVSPSPPSLPAYPGGGDDGTVFTPLLTMDLFDFTNLSPGKKRPVVLPGTSKKKSTKKSTKVKGIKTPGDLHNKYRNPLEIKFKL